MLFAPIKEVDDLGNSGLFKIYDLYQQHSFHMLTEMDHQAYS
jgi:hypothetical protein